jgi:hypothetical protein
LPIEPHTVATVMAEMSPMADEDSPTVIHKREVANDDTDGDALSPQKRPLNNNNNDVATVFLIDASDVQTDDQEESAVEVDEVIDADPFVSTLDATAGDC